MANASQPPIPPASSGSAGDGRDAALHAAERELQAAREALQAAERRLAEAQAVAAAEDGSAFVGQAARCQQTYAQDAPAGGHGQEASGAQVPFPQTPSAQTAYQQSAPGSAPNAYQQPSFSVAQGAYRQPPASAQGACKQPPVQPHYAAPLSSRDHVAAGLLAIFLGGFGVHKFYLGYNTQGFILLALSLVGGLFSFGLIAGVVWIISIIEGIIYLTKTQSEFEQLYVYGRHEWF